MATRKRLTIKGNYPSTDKKIISPPAKEKGGEKISPKDTIQNPNVEKELDKQKKNPKNGLSLSLTECSEAIVELTNEIIEHKKSN